MGNGTTPCVAPVGDWAIDENTALLFSPEAPIAGAGPRDDKRAIWTFVPPTMDYAKFEALFYFHGHNNYVKVGFCNHKEGLVPDWVWAVRRGDMAGKASGPKYKLNALPTDQHIPLVIVPEVGTDNSKSHEAAYSTVFASDASYQAWKKEKHDYDVAEAAYEKAKKDKVDPLPAKPTPPTPPEVPPAVVETAGRFSDSDRVKKIIDNCCDRLRLLPRRVTTTSTYLDVKPEKKIDSSKLKRLYLTAHSGGGVPLATACTNDLALNTAAGFVPTDLWVIDATYGTGGTEYPAFCKKLTDANKLGNGAELSRFVAIAIKGTSTDTNLTAIVATMKSQGLLPTEIDFKGDADITATKSALMCNPIVIIRNFPGQSHVPHDEMPGKFIPIFLDTAGRKGTDCPDKSKQSK